MPKYEFYRFHLLYQSRFLRAFLKNFVSRFIAKDILIAEAGRLGWGEFICAPDSSRRKESVLALHVFRT